MNQSTPSIGYPSLAPLSTTLIRYSFEQRYRSEIVQSPLALSAEHAALQYQTIWSQYEKEVIAKRQDVYVLMDSLLQMDQALGVREKQLSSEWLRKTLALYTPGKMLSSGSGPQQKMLSAQAVYNWTDPERNILRKDGWGLLEPQSVAALLITRMGDSLRERAWLPPSVPLEEEWWWCWALESPTARPFPCPYPRVPVDLPDHTLLFTRWAGAGWNTQWRSIGYLGAVTFVGLLREQGTSIEKRYLERWYPGVSKLGISLDKMIDTTLRRLAVKCFDPSMPF